MVSKERGRGRASREGEGEGVWHVLMSTLTWWHVNMRCSVGNGSTLTNTCSPYLPIIYSFQNSSTLNFLCSLYRRISLVSTTCTYLLCHFQSNATNLKANLKDFKTLTDIAVFQNSKFETYLYLITVIWNCNRNYWGEKKVGGCELLHCH